MTKPFWDLEEKIGFVKVKSPLDSLEYRVVNEGTKEDINEVAVVLSKVRRDINTLLVYLCKNPQLWIKKPIAYGIIHTFDIHIPSISKYFNEVVKKNGNIKLLNDKPFNYQEMTPNKHGIIGLNKPKIIKTIKVNVNGKMIDYEIAEKRSIFLTIRNKRGFDSYSKIMDLAIHELTHTTCNDVRWKEDNHQPPYTSYHNLMRKWARECGILN